MIATNSNETIKLNCTVLQKKRKKTLHEKIRLNGCFQLMFR